jgi:DNA repair protein RadD
MAIELRPYQEEFLESTMRILGERPYALVQAPTGSGKTVCFAALIRRYMEAYKDMRIGVVVHRQELVEQNRDKLLKVWPEGIGKIGVACAGVGPVNVEKPVTIGSVQTMDRRDFAKPFRLLIVDEVHHIPAIEDGGQYHALIKAHQSVNPALRVLGVTATPYRLGHGYIYGDRCREGKTNLFPSLDFQITLNQLVEHGYLVPWRARQPVRLGLELDGIKLTGGEFNLEALSAVMSKEIHIRTAVETYERYGEDRQNVLVFAVTINHAEALAKAFNLAGHKAAAVHSELARETRRGVLAAFEASQIKVLVNVGVLTEGWDSPKVDCILMCRPTKSPSLFVQMLGRGTRICEGKADVLILDLGENFNRHGDPSDPTIRIGKSASSIDDLSDTPFKICPMCQALVPLAMKICPDCCHRFVSEEKSEAKNAPEMTELKQSVQNKFRVKGFKVETYVNYKEVEMAVLTIFLHDTNLTPRYYMSFADNANEYFKKKSIDLWYQLAGTQFPHPRDADEVCVRQFQIVLPQIVTVYKDKKDFLKVKELR